MRKIIVCLFVGLLLSVGSSCFAAPKAVPADKVYEFAAVPEGQGLTHEFIIKNQGDESLKIVDVIPP